MSKKKNNDQKAKESILNLCNSSGLNTWLVAKVAGSPGILYGAFHADGVNIYKFDKVQPILTQTILWNSFTNASVDYFSVKTVFTLTGERNSSTLVVLEKGKDLVPLLQSHTQISINIIQRPFWRKILGFRSKTKWKMVVAVIGYLMIFGGIINAFNGQPSSTSPTSSTVSTPQKAQEPVTISDSDKALLKKPYKTYNDQEIKQFKEIEDKYNKLTDADKAVIKTDYERALNEKKYQDWINNQFSSWDGSNKPLVDILKKNLNDPDSFEHVETTFKDMGDYLIVKMTYRAKNGFGGLVLQNVTAKTEYKTNTITIISQNN